MRRFLPAGGWILGLVALLLVAAGVSSPQAAPSRFDGIWSVLIVTEAGECDRAYRYRLRISNGTVRYEGDPGTIEIDVEGKVQDSGRISVSVSRGQQRADGSGRISQERGTGTWKGTSGTASCSGRWEAEKRGS
jgi:hypothetical protein